MKELFKFLKQYYKDDKTSIFYFIQKNKNLDSMIAEFSSLTDQASQEFFFKQMMYCSIEYKRAVREEYSENYYRNKIINAKSKSNCSFFNADDAIDSRKL